MKKILLIILCAALLTPAVSADAHPNSKRRSWSFRSLENGEQPELMGGDIIASHRNVLCMGDKDEKVIYLTFDAGYADENVTKTLDILKKHSAPAAFFILPAVVKYANSIAVRMAKEGHLVCNHTFSHRDVSSINDIEIFKKELTDLEAYYKEGTGYEMAKYFRPPEGSFSDNTLEFCETMGYKSVFWSFAYADWDNKHQKDPSWAKEKILSSVHNGMVMLLHPNSATNAAILDDVMTELENKGYTFESLEHLEAQCESRQANIYQELEEYKKKGMVVSDVPEAGKEIALTFDDGPSAVYTPQILDILGKYGIKATFFVLGENAEKYPELIRRILEEGHEIGNHTYNHVDITGLSSAELANEINKTGDYLKDEFSYTPILFRPPGGSFTPAAIEEVNSLGYKYILWSWRIDTKDWARPPASSIVNAITSNVEDGSIILLHDGIGGKSNTPEALEEVIPILIDKGYSFNTVSGLIKSGQNG